MLTTGPRSAALEHHVPVSVSMYGVAVGRAPSGSRARNPQAQILRIPGFSKTNLGR